MRKIITLLSCLTCLQLSAQITTYNISRSINCTDTIQPFATNDNSYGISIDGEGRLFSDTAFIRVVLVDNNGDEWLVYERNSLFATELYDLQGRLVRTQNKAFRNIDMSQLPTGTYTMRVIMEDGMTYSDKVVKE